MMYQPLTLYYLHQLGIRPWIAKPSKLLILCPRQPSKQVQWYLKSVVTFIDHLEYPYQLVELDSNDRARLAGLFQQSSLSAVLTCGLEEPLNLEHFSLNCPVISNASLNLEAKKKLFELLYALP